MSSNPNIKALDRDSLLDLETILPYFETEDDVVLAVNLNELEARAKEIKCSREFGRIKSALLAERKKSLKAPSVKPEFLNQTNFPAPYNEPLQCKNWIANENGVRKIYAAGEIEACAVPILPIEYYRNIHTGLVKVKMAYYSRKEWTEILANYSDITSAQNIVKLSAYGFPATSQTAKALVQYLSDMENLNKEKYPMRKSTAKMGWQDAETFTPYDDGIVYDGGSEFAPLYDAIHPEGSYETWLKAVREIRATKRIEPLFFLAASFGSPLLEWLGVQSFAVNLWGDTGGGKTICTRLASSVWADSREGKYWGSFLTTEAAIELKQNFLNNLPCLIDDSSNVKDKEHFNFSTWIYNRCNEKGKARSNVKLGINQDTSWRQIILMTGEQPVVTESMQGGAINRTLELCCGYEAIFAKPSEFCEMLDENFGWAGRDFIDQIKRLGKAEVKDLFREQYKKVVDLGGSQKQSKALAVIMTADILVERLIFRDKINISLREAADTLTDGSAISENLRCYDYLRDQISIHTNSFVSVVIDRDTGKMGYKGDAWGDAYTDEEYAYIIKSKFEELCVNGGFSGKKFLDWAKKQELVKTDSKGSPAKTVYLKYIGRQARCVCLKMKSTLEEEAEPTEQQDTFADDFSSAGIPF